MSPSGTLVTLRLRDAEGGLAAPALAMDEMLPDIECPRRVASVLEDSDESVDSGRGMNSRVSEKPTRAREGAVDDGTEGGASSPKEPGLIGGLAGPKKARLGRVTSAGVVGALPAR